MLSAALATLEKLGLDMELKSFTLNHNRFNQVQLIVRFDASNLGDSSSEKNSQTITKKSNYHQKRDKLRLDSFNKKFKNKSNAASDSAAILPHIQDFGNPLVSNVDTAAPDSGRKSPGEIASGLQDNISENKSLPSVICETPHMKSTDGTSTTSKSTDGATKKGKQATLKSKITGVFSTSLAVKKSRKRDEISYPVYPLEREPYEFRARSGSVSSVTTGGKDKVNVRTPPIPRVPSKTSRTLRRTGSSSSSD